MASSNFAIVNLREGVRRDVTPFLLQNDEFPILENMYLFRGRIVRRSCFSPCGTDGRLKINLGNTGASPFTFNLLDGAGTLTVATGVAVFTIGNVILTDPGGASPVTLLSTNPSYSGTLNRTTGALSITIPAIAPTPVYYLPGLPVMGLRTLEQNAINSEQLMAFDTRYSYQFDDGTGDFLVRDYFYTTANTFCWTGANSDQFWSCNYRGAFWATNNNPGYHAAQDSSAVAEGDGIRWYGQESGTGNTGWANFNPQLTGGPTYLLGGLIILPYKDRLLVLNTYEGANLAGSVNYAQRARWSQNGTPFFGAHPTNGTNDSSAWRSDVVGKGGFIDAPTSEAIVSAQFVKDTLVVYFERSTWQLVYTYNETLPFVWQKINTELGTESTFSVVPFDRGAIGIGNYGIITTDSVNVVRIDEKIPDEVFQIQNTNNGPQRASGVRDYNAQLVYFSYPMKVDEDGESTTYTLTFPNQVLVYNYLDHAWAEFDDSFTCFGYWQRFSDVTWAQLPVTWESRNAAWNSQVFQGRYPDVVAGNQRGFVLVFSQLEDNGQNCPSIPIANITSASYTITAPDHNFVNNQYVMFTGIQGVTSTNSGGTPNNVIYKVTQATASTFVAVPVNPTLDVWSGTYTGGGLITHIPNFTIETKQFNPFYEQGDGVRLSYIEVYTDRTSGGEFTANFFTSSNTSTPIDSQVVDTSPEPAASFSANQDRIWHRIYTNSFGSFFQNKFTLSDTQIRNLSIATSDITIHGLIYYVNAAGRLSYDI